MDDGEIRIAKLPHSQGIECPRCGCFDSEVLRTKRYTGFVMRERQCRNIACAHRWTTCEKSVETPAAEPG
jgi:transcriptional regulator NrdR family protein